MKLFIDKDIIKSKAVMISCVKRNKTTLIIPNINKHGKGEDFKIDLMVRPAVLATDKNVIIDSEKIVQSKVENRITFRSPGIADSRTCYALLKSNKEIAPEIFIPAEIRDKIEIVKKFQHYEYGTEETSNERYLTEIYLLRFNVLVNEIVPIYFSSKDGCFLDRRIDFTKNQHSIVMIKDEIIDIKLNEDVAYKYAAISTL